MKNSIFPQSMKKQRGFTAIELFVVIIVGIGLFIYAANNIDKLFGSSAQTEEVRNIQQFYVNVKSLKTNSGYGTSGTDLLPSVVAINGVPKNMTVTAGVPYNEWGGAIAIASTGTGFTITYNAVPQDACVALAQKLSSGGNFASVKLNANAAQTGQISAATAATQCNSATANVLVFTSNT